MAIKLICRKKAPPEYLSKFMPREIDSLNATCRHHNVVNNFLDEIRKGFLDSFNSKVSVIVGPEFFFLFYSFQDRGFDSFAENILRP